MDPERAKARRLLGVAPDASTDEVRAAYRALMRRHHPDTRSYEQPNDGPDDTAARLTAAYALLTRPDPLLGASPSNRTPVPPPDGPPHTQVRTDGAIVVEAPGPETYMRVHDALDELGDVTYLDRSGGYLQALVHPEGGPLCTLIAVVEARAIDSVVLISLEPLASTSSIDSNEMPPIELLLQDLARLIAEG